MACRFLLCDGCSRHVKTSDPSCPFCGRNMAGARPSSGEPYRRMAAAAAVAAGVAAITGCSQGPSGHAFYGGSGVVVPPDDSGSSGDDGATGSDAPSTVAFYGIANPMPDDASSTDASTHDAGDSAPPGDGSASG